MIKSKENFVTSLKKLNINENTLNKLIKDLERDGILNISKNKYIEIKSN